MSKSERFKFGEINLPKDSLPSPDDVYEAISDGHKSIKKQDDIAVSGLSDSPEDSKSAYLADHDRYSCCHFQYRTATEHNTVITNRDRIEKKQAQISGEYLRVFYFENGQFAINSIRNLMDQRVPEFIGAVTGIGVGDEYEFYGQDVAGQREQDHTVTIGSASKSNGEKGNKVGSRLRTPSGLTEDEEHTGAIDIESNVNQSSDIVDETAEKIRLLDGTRGSEPTDEVFASGTVVATWSEKDWPSDAETERRAETIREKIVPYLRKHA